MFRINFNHKIENLKNKNNDIQRHQINKKRKQKQKQNKNKKESLN